MPVSVQVFLTVFQENPNIQIYGGSVTPLSPSETMHAAAPDGAPPRQISDENF